MRALLPSRTLAMVSLLAALLIVPVSAPAADALSHIYATIKPPAVADPDEASPDANAAERADEPASDAAAEPPATPPAGDGGLANVYATLKPAENLDVETTGSIGGARPGFVTKVETGAIWVRASAPTRCLPGDLTTVVAEVAERFGEVRIMSTHRTRAHNRRAGGARHSMHLSCRAIDFRVAARGREVMAYLRDHPAVGGLKRYRSGLIHIDNGERRTW
ncbi:MAG: YcbK family protein [Salinarimonas sp.]